MDDTTIMSGFHVGAMASLLLQGATAFMVYQLFLSTSAGTRGESRSKKMVVEEEKKDGTQDKEIQSHSITKVLVSATEARSIRGTNIYGPYKKVSKLSCFAEVILVVL